MVWYKSQFLNIIEQAVLAIHFESKIKG